jgi:HK97 family phage major capsid protein
MTTPANLPAPPAVNTGDFQGTLVPPDVQARIINLLVDSAPFAASLAQIRTSSSTVAFPVAAPSGAAWINELDLIPLMSLNDDAVVVAVAKLAGLLDVSNEMMSDPTINVTASFTTLLQDSLSRQLDDGLLNGSGPPEPAGVVAVAPAATGATLLAAVAAAKGSIADAGGTPTTLAMSGAAMAAADTETDIGGQMIYPGGFGPAVGLAPVTVPGLATPLVYDASRVYCIVNGQLSSVEASADYRFQYDATTFRVKSRVTAAVPDPAKAIRKLTISGGTQAASAKSTSKASA